jgi:hypothetical protein
MYTVRTYETEYNTYYLGYGRTAKTSYEQQQERKERFLMLLKQRLIIFSFIIGMYLFSHFGKAILGSESGIFLFLGLIIGLPTLLYNKQIIG